ncbi:MULTISPECIES: DUF6479 family protein [unclassified Streptomyces]|uniref:DUF6479 family protein n=1 Tax=unclassified Streptomyces TaxID=2593676 RepID=UPI0022529BF2|nr:MULTISPECIES: DUF6479 family protein [unclassified Streptomyces]MCX5134782.1 DUF6479 family protein [Streptomyces sp. NBC_00340]
MINAAETTLAASSTGALWLIVAGVVIVVGLLVAFFVGSRRSARRQISTPVQDPAQMPHGTADPAQRGDGWQTPEGDPEQGHPRR